MKNVVLVIVAVVVLGVGYYAISPLFRNVTVDDSLPTNLVQSGVENLTQEELVEMKKQNEEVSKEKITEMEDVSPDIPTAEPVSYAVMGTTGHPASGTVKVLETISGTVIRYEDFSTINGPNLHIYLAKDLRAKDYIDLGSIKGTKGNINYDVPEDIDISEYKYVMYWCVPFKVLFNYAEIN